MSNVTFQSKPLRRVERTAEYRVYLAALEWDLEDPIVIEGREDLKSVLSWKDRLEPYHHQVTNLITFCRRLPVTLIADDVGLGKTISAGLVISELVARSRISRVLVVCPKILGLQWKEELESKFNIHAEIAIGRELVDAEPVTGVVITTYNTAQLYLEELPPDRFQMLILDEAHKLRNLYGVKTPPQVAMKFRAALESRRFRFVLMLTATPIHNRLWDLYSLVDLLTVARGHQNPFGNPDQFARKFIADKRDEARQLKPEAKQEFRSIVYGYMSRMRRGDAKLYFPDRVVQMHRVNPTAGELALIRAIAKPIQNLNKLSQISILQALTSSPQALLGQLNNMARNNTVPLELASTVKEIVDSMPHSAKLLGLAALIEKLRLENPDRWRLVVFTTRRETQATIEAYLKSKKIKVGVINGDSGKRNQETIAHFRKDPPDLRVIVSTEAGSEGVNLQVANVLVNYDLPWNPMIVEQRIGRIQRLASEHASVAIFNIMLRGTYEEYIVGRLMEKLQLASHAIGDIEALLEASGMGEDEDGAGSFDEKIRQLVLAALAGKDVAAATIKAEESIEAAKKTLQTELAIIDDTLGRMEGAEYVGPRSPSLPAVVRSMPAQQFALAALASLGGNVTNEGGGSYLVERGSKRTRIKFDDAGSPESATLCAPGSAFFSRTVDEVIATPIHDVTDSDLDSVKKAEDIARKWVSEWGGEIKSVQVESAQRRFEGFVVLRVRATVAHDSYERLVEVECPLGQHVTTASRFALSSLPSVFQEPSEIGIDMPVVSKKATFDEGIQEFTRFYLERRSEEIKAAGSDERLKKRLEDEFTPRLGMTLVAAKGQVTRQVEVSVEYRLGSTHIYGDKITVVPGIGSLMDSPEIGICNLTKRKVPVSCLASCDISKTDVLRHLLVSSGVSSRQARPEYVVTCSLSGKKILSDEAAQSDVSGRLVSLGLLSTSVLSGKRAEAAYMGRCESTGAAALQTELLECEHTKKRVLPSELERCAVTGKNVLKNLLVKSSLSGARLMEQVAIRSAGGKFCLPTEAKACAWTANQLHVEDLRVCRLTGLAIGVDLSGDGNSPRLQPLGDLLNGMRRNADQAQLWPLIEQRAASAIGRGKCKVEAAILSPDQENLAVVVELRTMLGFKVNHVGFVFNLKDKMFFGKNVYGKRGTDGWTQIH